MYASTPSGFVGWKRLFLGLEIFVAAACIYGMALRITWRYDTGEHPFLMRIYRALNDILMPTVYSFLAACAFLLLASPFFLRSLRAVAIRAWIVGALAFLCAGCILFFL